MTGSVRMRDPVAYAAVLVARHGRVMAYDVAWRWQQIYGHGDDDGPSFWPLVVTALRHNPDRKPFTKAERRRLREKRRAAKAQQQEAHP